MGRSNYTQTEIFNMIDAVRKYLPISGLEWDLVVQRHMAYHPAEERSGDQLKKKFNKLAKMNMGTGDPVMSPDVREAKEICRLIIEKSEGVTGSEDEIFAAKDVCNKAKSEGEEGNLPEDQGLVANVGVMSRRQDP